MTAQQPMQQKPPSPEPEKKSLSRYVEIMADWLVDIISFPISFCAYVISRFLTPGTSGTRILGGIGFIFGLLLSADGIWQTLFQGTPLFPWWESSWVGWWGWLGVPFNLFFWLSLAFSWLIQVMEAKTLRGKSPEQAKMELEEHQRYALGAKPTGSIDLVNALWGDYKRAGMKQRHGGGLIALFFWLFDAITTFSGRNPFRYTDPWAICGCILFNLVTMGAGEIGFAIWRQTK